MAPFNNKIENFNDLYVQAGNLSYAQGADDRKLVKGNDEVWCIIGLLFNPVFNLQKKEALLKEYQDMLEAENLNQEFNQCGFLKEPTVLSIQGEILLE